MNFLVVQNCQKTAVVAQRLRNAESGFVELDLFILRLVIILFHACPCSVCLSVCPSHPGRRKLLAQ